MEAMDDQPEDSGMGTVEEDGLDLFLEVVDEVEVDEVADDEDDDEDDDEERRFCFEETFVGSTFLSLISSISSSSDSSMTEIACSLLVPA